MGLIIAILLGAFVGWLAAHLLGRKEGFFGSAVIGVIGSFLGGWLSHLVTGSDKAFLAFSWTGLFWSLAGSVLLVAILNWLQGRPNKGL